MDVSKVLNKEQGRLLRHAKEMSRIISTGCATPATVTSKLNGKLPSRSVCRAMRTLTRHYSELRKQVKEHNSRLSEGKTAKVKSSVIWHYVMTGRTTSERLHRIGSTHPLVDKIIQACIAFRKMIHGEDDAPDIAGWIRMASECQVREMTEFAEYIRKDKDAIEQACLTNYSNAVMEGTVNKIKAVKRSMYNRAGVQMLRAKLIYGGVKQYQPYHLN